MKFSIINLIKTQHGYSLIQGQRSRQKLINKINNGYSSSNGAVLQNHTNNNSYSNSNKNGLIVDVNINKNIIVGGSCQQSSKVAKQNKERVEVNVQSNPNMKIQNSSQNIKGANINSSTSQQPIVSSVAVNQIMSINTNNSTLSNHYISHSFNPNLNINSSININANNSYSSKYTNVLAKKTVQNFTIYPYIPTVNSNQSGKREKSMKKSSIGNSQKNLTSNSRQNILETKQTKIQNQLYQHKFIIIPARSQWFSINAIHQIQKKALPQWFKQKKQPFGNVKGDKFEKNQQLYKRYRNHIIQLGKHQYVSAYKSRMGLAGDACSIIRIHDFLEKWGLINYIFSKKRSQNQKASNSSISQPSQRMIEQEQYNINRNVKMISIPSNIFEKNFNSAPNLSFNSSNLQLRKQCFDKQKKLAQHSKKFANQDLQLLKKITKQMRPHCHYCQGICGVVWYEYRQNILLKKFVTHVSGEQNGEVNENNQQINQNMNQKGEQQENQENQVENGAPRRLHSKNIQKPSYGNIQKTPHKPFQYILRLCSSCYYQGNLPFILTMNNFTKRSIIDSIDKNSQKNLEILSSIEMNKTLSQALINAQNRANFLQQQKQINKKKGNFNTSGTGLNDSLENQTTPNTTSVKESYNKRTRSSANTNPLVSSSSALQINGINKTQQKNIQNSNNLSSNKESQNRNIVSSDSEQIQNHNKIIALLQKNKLSFRKTSQDLKITEFQLLKIILHFPVKNLQKLRKVDIDSDNDLDGIESQAITKDTKYNLENRFADFMSDQQFVQRDDLNIGSFSPNKAFSGDSSIIGGILKSQKEAYQQFVQHWILKINMKMQRLTQWDQTANWSQFYNARLQKYVIAQRLKRKKYAGQQQKQIQNTNAIVNTNITNMDVEGKSYQEDKKSKRSSQKSLKNVNLNGILRRQSEKSSNNNFISGGGNYKEDNINKSQNNNLLLLHQSEMQMMNQ